MAENEPDAACPASLQRLVQEIEACRICREQPQGKPLPHEPRPVVRVSATATILVCGQAPGTRVHASGLPFDDASGRRLRDWMGVDEREFYDRRRIAFLPMGFCFPGLDPNGGDLPPRKECAPAWRDRVIAELHAVRLLLLIGRHAQRWHLGNRAGARMTDTVAGWQVLLDCAATTDRVARPMLPLPHPSWRNTDWLKRNPWFERELVPELRRRVRAELG